MIIHLPTLRYHCLAYVNVIGRLSGGRSRDCGLALVEALKGFPHRSTLTLFLPYANNDISVDATISSFRDCLLLLYAHAYASATYAYR